MAIVFARNVRPTIGVELELHLVGADGDLVSVSNDVLDELGRTHGGEHPKAKHELFQSTIEVITGICDSPRDAGADLAATVAEVRETAKLFGADLLSSGTHPFARAADQVVSPATRYHDLVELMQWPARRLLICGMHVHVAVSSGERSIRVMNELSRWLPLFLALSSSSPYFEGEDSGLASTRSKVFEALPTAGLPPHLADWADFEAFMATLLDTGCIGSIREVWWDIRPHPDFGTVELRMCDSPPTLAEVVSLAALAQALVVWCEDRLDRDELGPPPREWTVRENRWLAGRYGTDAELIVERGDGTVGRRPVVDILDDLLVELEPVARRLGSVGELVGVRRIVDTGSGAQRQRAIVEGGGSLVDVVRSLSAEFAS